MKLDTRIKWMENLHFQASTDGFSMDLDASPVNDKPSKGPRPKPLLLTSLGGCTAMDVISILQKMKNDVLGFEVFVEGENSDEHPKKFTGITIRYILEGNNIIPDNVKKAVSLSIERYCGVYATLIKAVPVNIEIFLNGEKL